MLSGGCPSTPALFEAHLEAALGDRIRDCFEDAEAAWAALSNVVWTYTDYDVAAYSFREAGALVADMRADGSTYLDWYCCTQPGVVAPFISEAMAEQGWHHQKRKLGLVKEIRDLRPEPSHG